MEKIKCCDCLTYSEKTPSGFFDLIYLDPPFFAQQTLKSSDSEYSFEDKWKNRDEYLCYMKKRFIEFKRILKETGSIFVHCDRKASHYLKVILDDVFGESNFQSEIVWSYKRWSNSKKGLLNAHQIILFYSKSEKFKFNEKLIDYSPTTNLDQILQLRKRDENGKCVYDVDENGKIINVNKKKGVPLSDVWEIPFLNPKAKERVNYPTQKPLELLEQIIEIVTDENDKVYDPFCGSGTTLVAAKLLNREYYGTDISNSAIELTLKRLEKPVKTESILRKKGYSSYVGHNEKILNKLKKLNAKVVQRNKGMDGLIESEIHNFIPVKFYSENDSIEKIIEIISIAALKKNLHYAILFVPIEYASYCKMYYLNEVNVQVVLDF